MLKNINSFVTFSPLRNSSDCYKFQDHAEECVTIFSNSRIFLNHMESFSNLIKIPVYEKAVNFLQTDLYTSIVWHLILGFILWVKHFYLSLLLHRASCRLNNYHKTNKCTKCM